MFNIKVQESDVGVRKGTRELGFKGSEDETR